VPPRPKRTEYVVNIDRALRPSLDGGRAPLDVPDGWTPEHLVLAALTACIVTSFGHHARRAGLDHTAQATAKGAVSPREDGRWGFVELECLVEVELDPPPPGDETGALLARAENGCFIGASLKPKPAYRWRVNGADYSY
jgi:organic hydroperoxide reductase OsmC/OhrA